MESQEQEGDLPISNTQDTGACSEYSINFFIGYISFQIALHHRSHLQSSELFHFRFS